MLKKVLIILPILVFTALAFVGGYFFGKSSVEPEVIFGIQNQDSIQPAPADFSLFWQTLASLESKFADRGKIDFQKLVYGAIGGMVKSLEDPYTIFFEPTGAKRFQEDVKGSFEGVGMEVGIKKGQLQVVSPLENTPAQKAGLKAGDQILEINGTSTSDLTIDEAVNLIRGPKGTEVALTIFRESWGKTKEIKIIRDVIQVPSLKLEFKDAADGEKIAIIHLYQFSESASLDFRKAAIDILRSPAKKIIIDLRNDPGGYLEIAQDIAGWLLKKDQTVVIEDFGGKQDQVIYKAQGNSLLSDYPAVVLINAGSASASEILAGALRDNRKITLVGEKSFGKGSVQEMQELKGGSSIKITVANWLTPKGNFISQIGLDPDVKVQITDKDIEAGKDPQLAKAIEILKGMK